jgi:hypothetical protein
MLCVHIVNVTTLVTLFKKSKKTLQHSHFSAKNQACSHVEVEDKLGDIAELRHLPAHPNIGIDNRESLQAIIIGIDWLGFFG